MAQQPVVYFSESCASCARFLELTRMVPRLRDIALVSIHTLDPRSLQSLTVVPTVYDNGRLHAGSDAYAWLKNFDDEVELLTVADCSGAGLKYSSLDIVSGSDGQGPGLAYSALHQD